MDGPEEDENGPGEGGKNRGQTNVIGPFGRWLGVRVLKAVLTTVLFADTNGGGETDNSDETKQQEENASIEKPGQQVGIDFNRHPIGM